MQRTSVALSEQQSLQALLAQFNLSTADLERLGFAKGTLPANTSAELADHNPDLHDAVNRWLRKHGKVRDPPNKALVASQHKVPIL